MAEWYVLHTSRTSTNSIDHLISKSDQSNYAGQSCTDIAAIICPKPCHMHSRSSECIHHAAHTCGSPQLSHMHVMSHTVYDGYGEQ